MLVIILVEIPLTIVEELTLEVGIDNKKYVPKYCDIPGAHNCYVSKKGLIERLHCYDINFPFYLKIQKYICNGHHFHILNEEVILKLPFNIQSNLKLLVLDKIVLVCTFYYYK